MASHLVLALDAALDAGWYLTWRLSLWVFAGLFCAYVAVRMLLQSGVLDATVAYVLVHSTAELGFLIGVIPWLLRLNRLVDAWARARHARHLSRPVRWGIVWRSGLISLAVFVVAGIVFTLAETLLGHRPALMTVIQMVIIAGVYAGSMIGVGWAMLTMVARQIPPSSSTSAKRERQRTHTHGERSRPPGI